MTLQRWDIFCRVIDNYGDIGVCWRLARQLAAETGAQVRLWLDDWRALATLEAALPAEPAFACRFSGVEICPWRPLFPEVEVADVVIEAFACELPESYQQAMALRPRSPVWINLEYLSAESWIESCHALASPHPRLPLRKHFFFPGFTPGSGGLIREQGLLARRDALQADPEARQRFAVEHGLDLPLQVPWISLFCYDQAPLPGLLEAWSSQPEAPVVLVPPGKPTQRLQEFLPGPGPWVCGALHLYPIPFLSQQEYDRLLALCDINFVRGEDSFVRAQWAGRPFIWHIYPQDDAAHLLKLEAFLERFADTPANQAAADCMRAWNRGEAMLAPWQGLQAQLPAWRQACRDWSDRLAQHHDLLTNLLTLCHSKV